MTGRFARDQVSGQRRGRHRQRLRTPAPRPAADPGPADPAVRQREADLAELERLIGRYPEATRWLLARRDAGGAGVG